MSEGRVGRSSGGDGTFEIDRVENGRRVIYGTDDEGDYIRQNLAGLVDDFDLTNRLGAEFGGRIDATRSLQVWSGEAIAAKIAALRSM